MPSVVESKIPGFVEIYNPKKRNEIIQNYLQNRKEHKVKNFQERNDLENIEDHRIEVFKPILESNKKLQEEIIDEKNKIVETLNQLKPTVGLSPTIQPKAIQNTPSPKSLTPSRTDIVVSNLIASYLQDNSDKNNAGYSLRFDTRKKKYTIGNKDISFDNNIIKIDDSEYVATPGLLELLIKKSPNLSKLTQSDKQNYREILFCSNALYQGFDNTSKRYNADASGKWKFIKSNYFVAKQQGQSQDTSTGSSIDFLPSNVDSLINSLRLSIGSYQAGNKSEFNKIHAILDELLRQKKIKKKDLPCIYLNIGL